jgi:hypothetical protein
MPRRAKVVDIESATDTKRLFLYAGSLVSEKIVNQLGIRYAVESPAIARLTSAPEASKRPSPKKKSRYGQRYTRMRLLTTLVHELASRDALRVEASKFYLKHIEFFSAEPTDKRRIGLRVDPETYALCLSLPYSIVGTASISLMYRVIMHFFAVKKGIIKAPPVSERSKSAKLHVVQPYDPNLPDLPDRRTGKNVGPATSLSIDLDGIEELKHLCAVFKSKQAGLVRALIRSVANDDDQLEGVKKFYRQEFVNKEPVEGRGTVRLNLTKQEKSLLEHLSYSIMGKFNRSLTARCIIGYFNKSGDIELS